MTAYREIAVIVTIGLIIGLVQPDKAIADNYKSYQDCRRCHNDIFKLWSGSLHAKSFSNPSFQASYMTTIMDRGQKTAKLCLQCHAPLAHMVGDFDFKSPAAAEGISCWFCHSVSSVNTKADISNYYHLDTTGTIYGPYETTDTTGHNVQYSPLHLRAEMCAGCHEYTNEAGVNVLGTFTEWSESSYPKNEVYCQNCHMPIITDLAVVDGQKVSNYYVTAHDFQGGHSNINLSNAVKLKTRVKREGSRLDIKVHITNAESGHMLPTGIPIRRLVLTIALKSTNDAEISSARKVYRKVLTDKYGTIIENAPDMFLSATAIYSDNRIKPQETRIEEFVFILPDILDEFKIVTLLNYEYTLPMLKDESVTIEMARNVIPSRIIK